MLPWWCLSCALGGEHVAAVVVAVAVAAAAPPAAVVSFAVLFVLLLSWVTNFWRRDDDCGDAAFDARSVQSHARPL